MIPQPCFWGGKIQKRFWVGSWEASKVRKTLAGLNGLEHCRLSCVKF